MRLFCFYCKKSVSTELPDDAIIRACPVCPECIAKNANGNFEEAYMAARGTKFLQDRGTNRSQMYWKGRADAANDVRKLKVKE